MLHNIVTSLKMFVLVRLYKNMTCRFVFLRRQTDLRHAANRRHAGANLDAVVPGWGARAQAFPRPRAP